MEDNFADVELLREALQEHGVDCELTVISDGDRAIRFVEEVDAQEAECPDLVIVDLNLPKRPGRDVLQSIRQSVLCGAATVVVLSSSDAPRDVTDALELGASEYVRKPLHLEEFLALGALFKGMLEASGKG